jgi:hypothetical protein
MLTIALDENAGFKVNETGGFIRMSRGVIKADRFALARIFGFLSGSSPNRDGISHVLNFFSLKFFCKLFL